MPDTNRTPGPRYFIRLEDGREFEYRSAFDRYDAYVRLVKGGSRGVEAFNLEPGWTKGRVDSVPVTILF